MDRNCRFQITLLLNLRPKYLPISLTIFANRHTGKQRQLARQGIKFPMQIDLLLLGNILKQLLIEFLPCMQRIFNQHFAFMRQKKLGFSCSKEAVEKRVLSILELGQQRSQLLADGFFKHLSRKSDFRMRS